MSTFVRHYKAGNLNWPMIIYISLAHVAAIIGLCTIRHCHPYTLLWAFILWPISGLGITGGVHRLWAHRSYKASFPLRVFLMLANSIANQGSIWHWSRDHRVHHKYSEVGYNPQSIYHVTSSPYIMHRAPYTIHHPYTILTPYTPNHLYIPHPRHTLTPTTPQEVSSSRTWAGCS
ncbi:hypothetical protein EON63_11200 [archaeon]|nr:MAG: hypothetical protein EON63_11200 [archaeon]